MTCPPAIVQDIPERFRRCVNTILQAASVIPAYSTPKLSLIPREACHPWVGARHRVGARGQWKRPFEFPILSDLGGSSTSNRGLRTIVQAGA